MAKRSTIELLDVSIKSEVDLLIRDGKTLDQIIDHLRNLGDEDTSRSAVGRYAKRSREQMKRYQEAQQVAKVWIGRLEEDPTGDVGRLLSEMLRVVAFEQIGTMSSDKDIVIDPKDIMFLSNAIKNLAGADKTSADRELKIRDQVAKETAKKAATEAVKVAKKGGASEETLEAIRAGILGITLQGSAA